MYENLNLAKSEPDNNLGSYTVFDDGKWISAVRQIWKAINTNDCQCNIFAPWNLLDRTISTEQVDEILTAYMNVISDNEDLPEFTDEGKSKDSSVQKALIKKVANASAQNETMTHRVLRQLYWYTKDGTIKTTAILHPRATNKKAEDFVNTNPLGKVYNAAGNVVSGAADVIGSIGWLGKNLPYVLIAVGGILAIKYYPNFKQSIKGK